MSQTSASTSPITGGPAAAGGLNDANFVMLRQFYSNLSVQLSLCEPDGTERAERIRTRVQKILEPSWSEESPPSAFSWRGAYLAEQLLVALLPEAQLVARLARKSAEWEEEGVAGADELTEEIKALMSRAPLDLGWARAILLRVVNEDQWQSQQKIEIRKLAQRYRQRLNAAFLLMLAAFLAVLFVTPNFLPLSWTRGTGGGYSGLLTALVAGLFGASFSALIGSAKVKASSIEEMESLSTGGQIVLRMLVGAGGAAIIYFFFETGLIEGVAIPDLQQLAFNLVAVPDGFATPGVPATDVDGMKKEAVFGMWVPNTEVSLLVVWSFLAGFSETLVPRVLTQVETATSVGTVERRRGDGIDAKDFSPTPPQGGPAGRFIDPDAAVAPRRDE